MSAGSPKVAAQKVQGPGLFWSEGDIGGLG